MKLNKEWHLKNPMPKNPDFEQRVKWHLAHQQNCLCRPIPAKLAAEMKQKEIKLK
ncbi:MAG: hypothetical protein IPO01_06595 [Chitinophagaceae bacterium]|nr:hypothetical protein [Chitinophagaceae bacterium]MBK9484878.1 hypothetical protein [Chitinophagaceae bacterium]MBL0201787.1 hypothetical protein [Chitinophagaceae bacterium]